MANMWNVSRCSQWCMHGSARQFLPESTPRTSAFVCPTLNLIGALVPATLSTRLILLQLPSELTGKMAVNIDSMTTGSESLPRARWYDLCS
jgi:hypothetical protein